MSSSPAPSSSGPVCARCSFGSGRARVQVRHSSVAAVLACSRAGAPSAPARASAPLLPRCGCGHDLGLHLAAPAPGDGRSGCRAAAGLARCACLWAPGSAPSAAPARVAPAPVPVVDEVAPLVAASGRVPVRGLAVGPAPAGPVAPWTISPTLEAALREIEAGAGALPPLASVFQAARRRRPRR